MSEIRFYVSEKHGKKILDTINEHLGFENKSAFLNHCVQLYLENNDQQGQGKLIRQNNKKASDEHYLSKSLRLMENIAKSKKDSRAITNDLHSNKLEPEVVAFTAYLCEKIITTFKNTKEIKTTVDYVSKHIMTKTDTKSVVKYRVIMNVCPNLVKKSIDQNQNIEKKTQSKMYQYPKPPPIPSVTSEDDDLEEIPNQGEEKELLV